MTSPNPSSFRTKAEFAAGLTVLRQRADLSIRDLARVTGVPPATLGGYFSGRNLPLRGQLTNLRNALDACGVTGPDADAWLEAAERVRVTPTERPASPYPGLTSFGVDDAAVFFGREAETTDVIERLATLRADPGPSHGILAVVGASGSGKTSLLRAGVAAYLASLQRCEFVVRTPGADPLAMLAAARDELDDPAVLVIDQFEELFTATTDPDERTRFLTELTTLAPRILVVVGMRADFYAAAAREAPFVDVLRHGQLLLEPLGSVGLREAVVRPAEAVGVSVENGLVELVLSDLAPRDAPGEVHDAGALPLLSHALRAAWERGEGPVLTIDNYRDAEGIEGAIARTAEDAYDAVASRDDARGLFLRLVNIDNVAVTRRRVSGTELTALREADFGPVIDEFVARRLLTTGADTLEISHEALLSAWPRLRDWIDEDRIGLKLHRQVTEAANAWEQAGRDDTLLLRGARLDAAAELTARPTLRTDFNALEHEYVAAGVAAQTADRDRAQHSARRLQRLLVAVVVLLLVAAGLAVYGLQARSTADRAEQDAAGARDLAVSRQIAGQAKQLQSSDPALAQQLALVSYRLAGSDLARSALVDQSSQPAITRVLGAQGPTSLAVSRGATPVVAVSHADRGTVHLFRLTNGRPTALAVIPARDPAPNQVFALRISNDGRLLALSGQSRVVRLWDISDPTRPRPVAALPTGFTGDVQSIDFSPDDRLLAVAAVGNGSVRVWDVENPAAPAAVAVPKLTTPNTVVMTARFAPAGNALAAVTLDNELLTWRVSGTVVDRPRKVALGNVALVSVAWTPNSATILTGSRRGEVRVLNAASLRAVRAPISVGTGYVNALAMAPDGSRFAVASSDTSVSQWSTSTWTELSSQASPGPVTGVAYTATGATLLSTAADGTLRSYAASAGIAADGPVFNLAVSGNGTRLAVATGGDNSGVRLWDTGNAASPRAVSSLITMPAAAGQAAATVGLTSDGRLLCIGSRTGYLALWNVADPAHPRLLGRPLKVMADGLQVEAAIFSPDGRYVAAGGDDGTVRLLDVRDPTRPVTVSTMRTGSFVFNLAFSPNGRFVAAASADKFGYVWDVGDPGRPRRTARLGTFASYAYSVAISPDGRRIAVGSADHTTRLWQLSPDGRATTLGRPLIGPSGYVYGLTFSPDGTHLASASDDNAVRVYDVATTSPARVPELTLDSSGASMFSVLYSPDGQRLYGGGRAPSLSTWTVDVGRYSQQLCTEVGDRITRDEWAINVAGARYDPPCS